MPDAVILTVPEERPNKRRRILPSRLAGLQLHDKKLHDILPQPLVPVFPVPSIPSPPSEPTDVARHGGIWEGSPEELPSDPHHAEARNTPPNAFGVFRCFYSAPCASHDPEAYADLSLLSNITVTKSIACASDADGEDHRDYHPYPNQNSFLLGEWYWSQGAQKSQQSFKALLDIIGSPTFSPADVSSTNWASVNRQLAVNDWDQGEWVDEDAGWFKSNISIRVPFHRHLDHPGTRDFVVTDFYHRSLTSVIREKLSKKNDFPLFHFEPYELLWHPGHLKEDICLHGELYTSPSFVEAHQYLQASPREPGCDLPHAIVALMFWSDETNLSSFGHTKLWPLYLFFGNESKYRRCKPSNGLCEHVAYFQQVLNSPLFEHGRFIILPS